MTILEVMHDPALFGPWFRDDGSWRSWKTFLATLMGLPFNDGDLEIYRRHTGRQNPPDRPSREGWVVVGRRGGKSRIAALSAVYLACFRDYRPHLAPGEVGTLPVIAADRRQARTVMRYIAGFFEAVPMLKELVVNQTKETIELSNRVTIEVHTANFRAVRGYSLVAAILDEVAFWRTDDGSANPDTEILAALRPGMATIPGALLLAISSPYARRGALWEAYSRHFGRDGDPVLVWQGSTRSMNPAVDQSIIDEAYEQDEAAAAAEYGAEFRRDIESFISREAVEAIVVRGRFELAPVDGVEYRAFVDPSGGSQDSMTLAIAHREDSRVILDCIRERRPPFNPSEVVDDFVSVLSSYGIESVTGDRYAGEWPREQFRNRGISYSTAEKTKSDFYVELLPLVTSRSMELLDDRKLFNQLCGLERRTGRTGKDSIDHAPGGHDDLVNAVAGAVNVVNRGSGWIVIDLFDPEPNRRPRNAENAQLEEQMRHYIPGYADANDGLTCGHCMHRILRSDRSSFCDLRRLVIRDIDPACDQIDVAAA